MQLNDILALAAREGARRHLERRAGALLPFAVGAQIPGILDKAIERAHSTERQLNEAGHPMKVAAGRPAGQGIGQMIGHQMIGGAVGSFAKEIGTSGANLLRDIYHKGVEAVGGGATAARRAILGDLKKNDPVLANADDKTLMESYHTMTRYAPNLSTDKNAVRSFLRQSVMSGSGPDFMTIKLIADAERAVTGGKP